jgi:triacylglycerol lipase
VADIVLVHGFLNTGVVMTGLAARLRRAGHRCWVPTLQPWDGRGGIGAQACQLKAYIERALGASKHLVLIGFSMGALVGRFFMQELDGAKRVRAFFSISGPHGGTWLAHLYPSQGVQELIPGNPWLRALDETAVERLRGIPLVAYWTPFDAVIRPATSACWPLAERVRVPAWMHLLMLWDRRVADDIIRRLAEARL